MLMSETRFGLQKDATLYPTAIRRMSSQRSGLSLSKDCEEACEIEINDLHINIMFNSQVNAQRQGSAKPNDRCSARDQLREILGQYSKAAWKRESLFNDYFQAVEEFVTKISSCRCESCRKSRKFASRVPSNLDSSLRKLTKIDGSPRLFAISILIGDPFLVCWLFDKESREPYTDAYFYRCDDERYLRDDCGITEKTAKAIFNYKSRFFGRNIVEYIRSSNENGLAKVDEPGWLVGQMLLIATIMADPENESKRNFLENGEIGHLTFADHSGMDFTRTYKLTTLPWTNTLSLQSFGFLLLDMILFLDQDVEGVEILDGLRKKHPHTDSWFKNIDKSVIERLRHNSRLPLGRAFDLVRALIQPQGPFGLSPETGYEYFNSKLNHIFNDTFHDQAPRGSTSNSNKEILRSAQLTSLREKQAESSINQDDFAIIDAESIPDSSIKSRRTSKPKWSIFSTSSSSAGVSNNLQPKGIYIAESNFRWRSLYYMNEKNPRQKGPCWIQVSLKDGRLFFEIYPFDDIHLEVCTVADANLEWHSGLQFVPLYAYPPRNNPGQEITSETEAHRFRVRYKNLDASRDGIHYIFSAQNRKEAVQIQAAFTNQPVQCDKMIDEFSVESKTNFLSSGNTVTFQIWQVMNKDELDYELEIDKKSTRMGESSKPRFEMALFCSDKLVILDVTSQVTIEDLSSTSFKIRTTESKWPGRFFTHKSAEAENSEGRYPGLPLFKGASPEIWKDGEKISWVSVKLTFKSPKEKENMEKWLAAQYSSPPK